MNILFLSELLYPHGGGAEFATYLYASLLSKADFNVEVITNRFSGEPEFSKNRNLTIHRLPLFKDSRTIKYSILKRFNVLSSSFMRKMVKWSDVVYVPRFWFSAILLAKAYRKAVITHLHDYIPLCPLSNLFEFSKGAVCHKKSSFCSPRCIYIYEKTQGRDSKGTLLSVLLNSSLGRCFPRFSELSDAIICVSKMQKNILLKKKPSLRKKTYLVHNPLPKLSNTEMEGGDFGYFGGLHYLKGFHILYEAMRAIKCNAKILPRIHATKFPNRGIQFSKLLSRVGFTVYGRLNSASYERLYSNLSTVLVPSIWHEPWPYVVVEAITKGRYVIASKVGGIPEQVEGCKGAKLIEAGNHIALADAIECVSGLKREQIVDLGIQNRETFMKRYDNEKTIKNFTRICESLI